MRIHTDTHRPYQPYPRLVRELPADGKVTGPLTYAFTDGSHVSVTVAAHVNDDKPAVVFRGEDYLLHVHAFRQADGTWSTEPPEGHTGWTSVTRRANWSDAPPTYAKAIVAAVVASVPDVATPVILAEAEYADAYNDETAALEEYRKAKEAADAAADKCAHATMRRIAADDIRREA